MNTKCDVLVAGAGPVGLTMASELGRYGLSVRIIDQNLQRTDKSKALVVWARTLELMDRMGALCTQRFIETGLKIQATRVFSGREEIAHVDITSEQTESQIDIDALAARYDDPDFWNRAVIEAPDDSLA